MSITLPVFPISSRQKEICNLRP